MEVKDFNPETIKNHWVKFTKFITAIYVLSIIVMVYAVIAIYRTTYELTRSEIVAFLVTVLSILVFLLAKKFGARFLPSKTAIEIFDSQFDDAIEAMCKDLRVKLGKEEHDYSKKDEPPQPKKQRTEEERVDLYKTARALIEEYNNKDK